jgi:LEA14-like dessication related protein
MTTGGPDVRRTPTSKPLLRRGLAAGLIVLVAAVAGCSNLAELARSVPRPTAAVEGARIEGFSLNSLTLALDLRIDNPLTVDVPLVDADLRLASAGAEFLRGNFPLQGLVPAGGSHRVTVPVRVDLVQTLRTLSAVRPGQVVPYRAELDLSIDVPVTGVIALPLAHEGGLPVPAPPSVSLDAFALSELSLQKVAGTVALRVSNPNAFAVGLERLDVGLSLAGKRVGDLSAKAGPQIEAGGAGTLELPLALDPLQLGTAVFDVLRGNQAAYALKGDLAVGTPFGALRLPLDTSGQAPVTRTR